MGWVFIRGVGVYMWGECLYLRCVFIRGVDVYTWGGCLYVEWIGSLLGGCLYVEWVLVKNK